MSEAGPFLFQTWIVAGTATGTSSVAASGIARDLSLTGTATGTSAVRVTATQRFLSAPPARPGIERLQGGAVLEIRLWDPTGSSPPAWVEVTCDVISARATWGASRSGGVLTQADGGGLDLELYDPDRTLDPVNAGGPYFGFLRPGLWVRLSYDDGVRTVIKQARADRIEHIAAAGTGRISANDWVTFLNTYPYPNVLDPVWPSNSYATLHELAAAWMAWPFRSRPHPEYYLPVTVEPAPSPAIPIFVPNQQFKNPWAIITGAAEAALYMAWIDAGNVMRFSDATRIDTTNGPLFIGVHGPLALEFGAQIELANVWNRVQIAPSPVAPVEEAWAAESIYAYGERIVTAAYSPAPKPPGLYTTTEWINAVLYQHQEPLREALPLAIWPVNGAELRQLLAVRPMQQVVVESTTVSPPVATVARAIGAEVSVDPDGWSISLVTWSARGDVPPDTSVPAPAVPGAPTLVSATPGNAQVTLTWTAPTDSGSSAITGYTVTASPGGATCTTTGLTCTIGGLANGTSYSFTVRATNAVGTGPASNALSATPVAPPPPYRDVILATSGLVGYWRLGESSGTVAADETGAHPGVYTNAPTLGVAGVTPDGNPAITLNGTNQYVNFPGSLRDLLLDQIERPEQLLTWGQLGDIVTMEAWVNRNGITFSGLGGIISKGAGAYYMRMDGTSGQFFFVRSAVASLCPSTANVPATGWHHLVGTKNGATIKLYLDGVDVTGTVSNSTLVNDVPPLTFGRDSGAAEYFKGSIDEVALYSVALTPATVLAHYNARNN